MRLLFVNYEYPPLGGGGGVACRSVATALARQHEVHVLTSGAPGLAGAETVDGVRVWRAPVIGRRQRARASLASLLSFHPAAVRLGARLCRTHEFDLVASWFVVPSGTVGARLARRFHLPHAVLIMGSDVYGPAMWYAPPRNKLLGPVVRRILMTADHRTSPSADLARRARDLHGCTAPIEIVPHGVDPPPGLDGEPVVRPPGAPLTIVSVGRLVARKRHRTLLDAVARLPDHDLRLTLVGDGPERDPLERQARALGIADRVAFTGFVDEAAKDRLLAASDLFVLASEHEGFGLVYLEAMHHGLPVIAAVGGGHEDFLRPGETGRLVPRGDADALARAIADLARDPALRRRMGEHNRAIAARLTAAATARRYADLFARLARARGQRSGAPVTARPLIPRPASAPPPRADRRAARC